MGIFQKEPNEYKMLERFRIDIEKVNRLFSIEHFGKEIYGKREYCELIGECEEYKFFRYRAYFDGSGGYILRQDKKNPKKVVYFGESTVFASVYHNYLFQIDRLNEIYESAIIAKNTKTGEICKYNWLSNKTNYVKIGDYGNFYSQDVVRDMFVKDGMLVLNIERRKPDDPQYGNSKLINNFEVETYYDLFVTYEDEIFKAIAVYPNNIEETDKVDVGKHIKRKRKNNLKCEYKTRETECPLECAKCAIHIKDIGDVKFSENNIDEAILQYKKAAFIEPNYADVWVCLGKAYDQKCEYTKAIDAFDRALSIDELFDDALFNKAIALQKLGRIDDAIKFVNDLLALCDNAEVIALKQQLIDLGAKDVYQLDTAIEIMTNKALKIASQNNLLDKDGKVRTERAIYKKTEFSSQIFDYCQRKHSLLGEEKVRSESIITSFYASLCTTLFYYKDKDGFTDIHPFEYIKDHIDLEKADATAERMLEMKSGEAEAEALWDMIYDYAQFSGSIISKVDTDDVEAAIIDATESAYVLGMLYAMRSVREKTSTGRESIDAALEKLAESSKDYVNPPRESAMCYSISIPDEVEIRYQCNNCGKTAILKVWEGEENLIDNYRKLTSKFAELGHKTDVLCYCDECASFLFPSDSKWSANNIVFSFLANGLNTPNYSNISNLPVYSFPSTRRYSDFEYEVALSFLKGADTIEKLSEDTGTKLDAEVYLKHVRNVIGSTDI